MIPVKLQLRNFMCYRENVPPLLFDGFRVACLSGDNGNGKSALLDAITWALWGEARAKSDDDLIHQGQLEMEVEFEFVLGDLYYRVVRKRAKPRSGKGAGQTVLELQVANDGEFRSITGNSVRETEQKITSLLRMQYQTFINSAFLLQGRADEFTTKSASERKKVLADILGLAYYDTLEERARQQSRQLDQQRRELEATVAEIERELERRPQYEMELAQVDAELKELGLAIELQEARLTTVKERKRALDLALQQVREIDLRLDELKRELAELRQDEANAQKRLTEFGGLLVDRMRIETGYEQLRQTRAELEVLSQKLTQYAGLNERASKTEREIQRLKATLENDRNLLAHRVADWEVRSANLPQLEAELLALQIQHQKLERMDRQIEDQRRQLSEAAAQQATFKAANQQLRQEMEELKDRIDRLAQGGEKCPVCDTELGLEAKHHLEESYRVQGVAKREAYRANESESKRLTTLQERLRGEIEALQAQVQKERSSLQRQEATLEKGVTEAKAAAIELNTGRAKLTVAEAQLSAEEFARDERITLAQLKTELADLGYDFVEHEEKRKRAKELEPFDGLHRKLEQAAGLVAKEEETLERAKAGIERRHAAKAAEEQRRGALTQELANFALAQGELEEVQRVYTDLLDQHSYGKQKLGAARQRLDHCQYLEKQKAGKQSLLQKVATEKSIFDDLALAFGKKGVQAMIIEAVIPEIEAEANNMLSRMTDNRMHVAINTQRDTKKGDSVETLEIKISDELGTRNYELYSGGETFRVNFAIRVALSKLLARRAGARLQMLVIDEGFGTQDAAGREKLIDAINSVQDDFEKILVITHIQELKDAFPVRIDVAKTPEGSTLAMF